MAQEDKNPSALGTGMGMTIGQGIVDQIMLERNIGAQKRMGRFNQQLALDIWDKTNYPAQRRQMEKAGLNVGLLYKGAGEGGTTAGGHAEGVQMPSPNIGMAMQLGLQAQQTKAQIELTQAETEKVKAETPKVKDEAGRIKAETGLIGVQTSIAEIEKHIKTLTQNQIIDQIDQALERAKAETKSAEARAEIDKATVDEQIRILEQTADEQKLRMSAIKAGLLKTRAETAQIKEGTQKLMQEVEILRKDKTTYWDRWTVEQRETRVKEIMAEVAKTNSEFATSTAAQVKQWTSIFTDLISGAMPK